MPDTDIVLSGHDGQDAKHYQERDLGNVLRSLRRRRAMTAIRWSLLVEWSHEDQAFLITLPEWEARVINPVTHGDTYEEAVRNGREVLQMLVEQCQEDGRPLPALGRPSAVA